MAPRPRRTKEELHRRACALFACEIEAELEHAARAFNRQPTFRDLWPWTRPLQRAAGLIGQRSAAGLPARELLSRLSWLAGRLDYLSTPRPRPDTGWRTMQRAIDAGGREPALPADPGGELAPPDGAKLTELLERWEPFVSLGPYRLELPGAEAVSRRIRDTSAGKFTMRSP